MKDKRKILAVASLGGHWKQLLRIMHPLEADFDVAYVCTDRRAASMLPPDAELYAVSDFSRWDAWRLPLVAYQLWRAIRKAHVDTIITTGAAPGLIAVAMGRLLGCRTLWIDSIANASELSGSGRMARRVAHKVFTQWPSLAQDSVVEYHGNSFNL